MASAGDPNHPNSKLKYILICMSIVFIFALMSLILFFTISSSSRHHPASDAPPPKASNRNIIIREACKCSRDPPACQASLSQSNHVPSYAAVLDVINAAINVSSQNLNTGIGMIQGILDASADNQNRSNVAKLCLEVLHFSEYRTNLVADDALKRGGIKDARAWMSASLAYQYGCLGGLKYVNDTPLVDKAMVFFNTTVIVSSSDALTMMVNYDVFGDKTAGWGPVRTERGGFFEPGSDSSSGSGSLGGVPTGLKPDVTVCKSGCDYTSVQQAVNAGPDNPEAGKRFVIWIKTGVYEETVRIPLEKRNVVFLGDGMGKTVITGSMNVGQPGVVTYNTATVGIAGDGFMARDLTIENTAGPDAHQAVAFRSDSDRSILENCELVGNQDTVYAHSLRQYYKSCRIQGNVDFIFGNSASYFQDCLILIAPRQLNPEKGEDNAVTAQGRLDPAQSTGFVFENCVINGTDAYMGLYHSNPKVHKNYLGRPWKEYSRTVIIRCILGDLIIADGWMPWSGDFALKTCYYGEFENSGPGSDTSKRVNWSSQIPAQHAESYSVRNFIQGDQWIPSSS